MSWTENLKARWALKSTYQVIMVLIVFALTGTSVLFLKEPIFSLLGLTDEWSSGVQTVVYLITVLPLYQVLLLVYAALLGQFSFFWEFEKRSFQRLRRLWTRSQPS